MRHVILPVLLLAVAACGSSGQQTASDEDRGAAGSYEFDGTETRASITGTDGTVTTLRAGEKVPVKLPRGFTVAPGLTVLSNAHARRNGGEFVLLAMEGTIPVGEAIAFYRKQAEAAGVAITVDIVSAESTAIAGESADGLAFTAMASRAGAKTAVQLTVKHGLR